MHSFPSPRKQIFSLLLAALFLTTNIAAAAVDLKERGRSQTIWPGSKGFDTVDDQSYLKLPECDKFIKTATQRTGEFPLRTDQILVLKNGKIVYQWPKKPEDNPLFTIDTPHVLWSASKTVTAAITAAAMVKGIKTSSGQPLNMDTYLRDFFPSPSTDLEQVRMYNEIQLNHFFMMSTGMQWLESYASLLHSSFLPGLYGDLRNDAVAAALRAPMEYDPGIRFSYSGGNANILMGILKKLLPDTYATAPQDLLFRELGIQNAFFERDGSGHFIGSSYAYMSPKEMLAFGYLFLNGGYWSDGKSKPELLLPENYVDQAQILSDSVTKKDNKTPLDYIEEEGTFSNRSFWLNQNIYGHWMQKGHEIWIHPKEFPQSPDDMFFAAGHYGQLIMILPSQDMVIARTGQDDDGYWNKIDKLASQAVTCFNNYGENNDKNALTKEAKDDTGTPPTNDPLAFLPPELRELFSQEVDLNKIDWEKLDLDPLIVQLGALGFTPEKAGALAQKLIPSERLDLLKSGIEALETGLIEGIAAKELCSCVYVEKIGAPDLKPKDRLELCKQNTPTDVPRQMVQAAVNSQVGKDGRTIVATPSPLAIKLVSTYEKLSGTTPNMDAPKVLCGHYEGDGVGCRLLSNNECSALLSK